MAKVLLVDDERSIRTSLRVILAGAGYDVDAAEDADAASQLLSQAVYDVVLSDIVLPRLSGVALLQAIRRSAPDVPVIMMTGEPRIETAAAAIRAGAVDYLVKPVPRDAVLRSVANAVRLKAMEDERRRLEQDKHRQMKRMEQLNEELRRAAEFRDEVDAVTRHDLKSPLSVIIGIPQLLMSMHDPLSDKQREYLSMLERSGRRMLDMINQSIELFRMEQGMYAFHPKAVDVLSLITELIRQREPLTHARRVSIAVTVEGRTPDPAEQFLLAGERLLLHSALGNLIQNAVEASPTNGTVAIRLSGGLRRTVSIRNSGEVPQAIRDRFFGKYMTSGKPHGTGLGAYSARRMTEAQNGSIRLDASEPGATTIIVELPPPPDAAASAEVSAPAATAAATAMP